MYCSHTITPTKNWVWGMGLSLIPIYIFKIKKWFIKYFIIVKRKFVFIYLVTTTNWYTTNTRKKRVLITYEKSRLYKIINKYFI